MKTFLRILASTLATGASLVGSPRASTNYSIVADAVDGGGGRASSAAYNVASSSGAFASTGAASDAFQVTMSGFVGQDYEVRGFAVVATNTNPTSGGALQFEIGQALNDGTYFDAPPAGEVQWYRDGAEIPGATGATLILPSVQAFHAGAYSARVTNNGNSVQLDPFMLAVNAPAPSPSRLLNLSTRGFAQSGDNVLIPGFVIDGTASKRLLIRAVGPTLGQSPFNLADALPDPTMTLKRLNTSATPPAYVDVASNDDWSTNSNAADITSTAAQLFAFELKDAKESALLVDLAPGQYTAVASDKNGANGVGIVELYDADTDASGSRLINISNRGFCGVGAQVMIPGFVVSNEGPKTFLIRVVGPTRAGAPYNVAGTMADPKLEIYPGGASAPILTNDNWSDNPDAATTTQVAEQVFAFPLTASSKDAAFVVTLQPGTYTVVGSSAVADATGVVLVEVYVVP
jgi:hypothetical protein